MSSRSKKNQQTIPVWEQVALNGAAALFAVFLYSITMGQLLGSQGELGISSMMMMYSSSNSDNAQLSSVIANDRHEIHGAYVHYKYPRVSLETLAGTYARAPPTLESLVRPLPTDLVDLFDETLQPAPASDVSVDVVMGVLSDSAEQRQVIRNTWGGAVNQKNQKHVFFVVGGDHSADAGALEKEQSQFQDVIWVQSSDKTVQSMIFAAAVVKYVPNTRHLLTILDDTTYVRAKELQQVSKTQLKDTPYWGHCGPDGVHDKSFFQVPSEWKSSGIFPYNEFPKTATGAYLISWKIARCATHLASVVPPLPDAAKNMAVLARDCRVPCYHDERVQLGGGSNNNNDQNSEETMLIRMRDGTETSMKDLHTKVTQLSASAVLQYNIKPQESPFPYEKLQEEGLVRLKPKSRVSIRSSTDVDAINQQSDVT